jgi:hypothetical protein
MGFCVARILNSWILFDPQIDPHSGMFVGTFGSKTPF